ncbi:MAG: tripartite tricarboxylate transporter substrate-binding protein, partial [Methyloceanibacter sp.]
DPVRRAYLSERLHQPFLIENRPGAAGNVATMTVAHSVPDGYTLLMISVGSTVNAALYETHNYNLIRDIAPVAVIIGVPLVLENRSFPAKTVLAPIPRSRLSLPT